MDIKRKINAVTSELYFGLPTSFKLLFDNKILKIEGGTDDLQVQASIDFLKGEIAFKHSKEPNKEYGTKEKFSSMFKRMRGHHVEGAEHYTKVKVPTTPYTGRFITALLVDEFIPSLSVSTQKHSWGIITKIESDSHPMTRTSPLKGLTFLVVDCGDFAEVEYIDTYGSLIYRMVLSKGIRIDKAMKGFHTQV